MIKIILDTNFLMVPFQFRVDIFSEMNRICNFNYELCVIDKTVQELKILTELKGRDGRMAKAALDLLRHKNLKRISENMNGTVDDIIVETVKHSNERFIVATQDSLLKKILRKLNVQIITLRQKKYLILETFK